MRNAVIAYGGQLGRYVASFGKDRKAVTALEYGLIAGVITLVVAGVFVSIGTDLKNTLTTVATCVATPNATNCP